MATAFEREDIIVGLRELVDELRSAGEVAGIRLVGGAALALRYFDRGVTHDLDALHVNPGSDAAVFVIQVASPEALLAMKLRANRPGRDTRDIRLLFGLCGTTTLDEAENLYEDFYPGDSLSDRARQIATAIFADGPVEAPETPPAPVI